MTTITTNTQGFPKNFPWLISLKVYLPPCKFLNRIVKSGHNNGRAKSGAVNMSTPPPFFLDIKDSGQKMPVNDRLSFCKFDYLKMKKKICLSVFLETNFYFSSFFSEIL